MALYLTFKKGRKRFHIVRGSPSSFEYETICNRLVSLADCHVMDRKPDYPICCRCADVLAAKERRKYGKD